MVGNFRHILLLKNLRKKIAFDAGFKFEQLYFIYKNSSLTDVLFTSKYS